VLETLAAHIPNQLSSAQALLSKSSNEVEKSNSVNIKVEEDNLEKGIKKGEVEYARFVQRNMFKPIRN